MSDEQPLANQPTDLSLRIDKVVYWFTRHWLAMFNLVMAIYVGLPILAPVLMQAGATRPARLIYTIYSPMCHQMASRSFFLFGEQIAYPRELAGTAFVPIESYIAEIPEFEGVTAELSDLAAFQLAARRFLGNETMGYKTALCERDMSIYGFVLIGGLLYGLLRRRYRIKPMPVWAFIIFGLGPIALDGFSQLFSQFGAAFPGLSVINNIFPLRESTPFLRSLTGALLGLSLVWLAYPHVDASMKGSEENLRQKLSRYEALD